MKTKISLILTLLIATLVYNRSHRHEEVSTVNSIKTDKGTNDSTLAKRNWDQDYDKYTQFEEDILKDLEKDGTPRHIIEEAARNLKKNRKVKLSKKEWIAKEKVLHMKLTKRAKKRVAYLNSMMEKKSDKNEYAKMEQKELIELAKKKLKNVPKGFLLADFILDNRPNE